MCQPWKSFWVVQMPQADFVYLLMYPEVSFHFPELSPDFRTGQESPERGRPNQVLTRALGLGPRVHSGLGSGRSGPNPAHCGDLGK